MNLESTPFNFLNLTGANANKRLWTTVLPSEIYQSSEIPVFEGITDSFTGPSLGFTGGVSKEYYAQAKIDSSIDAWRQTAKTKNTINEVLENINDARQRNGQEPFESFQQLLTDPNYAEIVKSLSGNTGLSVQSLLQVSQYNDADIEMQKNRLAAQRAQAQLAEETQLAILDANLRSQAGGPNLASSPSTG
jgi:CHASE3 domain sensor protein